MLNLKKGLALVLAAATAFTFAPVANLGVTANAAAQYYYFVDKSDETINLTVGDKKALVVDASRAGLAFGAKITANVDKGDVVEVASVNNESDISALGDTAYSQTGTTINVNTRSADANLLVLKAVGAGTTNVTLTAKNGNDEIIEQQKITIHVTGQNLKISKTDESFWVNDKVYQLKDGKLQTGTNTNTQYDLIAYVDGAAADGDFYLTFSSTDATVASVAPADTESATVANGVVTKTALQNQSNVEYFHQGAATTPDKAVKDTGTEAGKTRITVPVFIQGVDIANKDEETVNITVKAYSSANAGTDFASSKYLKVSDKTVKVDKLIGQKTFTITLHNGTPELAVKYNPSNPTDTDEKTVSTYASGYAIKSGTRASDETDPIYLDTNDNTTAQLTAQVQHYVTPGFNTGRNLVPEFTVDYQGTDRAITVDNTGKVTVLASTAGIGEYTNYVVVRVPSVGQETDTDNYVAANEVRIPVKVSTKNRVNLAVATDGFTSAKAVGTTGYSSAYPKTTDGKNKPDTKGTASSADITLSNKADSKNSDVLTFTSNVADSYIDASIYSDAALTSQSDIATYDKTTKTIKAVSGKTGYAYVKVTALNDANTYGDASVVFVLRVTDKYANAKLAVKNSTITLNGTDTEDYIDVVSENVGTVSFKSDKAGIVDVDNIGKVTFNPRAVSASGSAIVTVSATAKDDNTLAPSPVKVTVNYNPVRGQANSAFAVSTQVVNVTVGETVSVNYTGANGDVTFKSNDESVATTENNEITGVKAGETTVTVTDAGNAEYKPATKTIKVYVKNVKKPAAVSGVKVANAKGAKVSVNWTSQGKNVLYRVYKKVGNGSWKAKNVTGAKASLSVKKGATVTVKVKAFVRDANGTAVWGPKATKAKAFKTDKK